MNSPSNICCDSDERVDLPTSCSECVYEWIVYSGFFTVCRIWESIVAVDEFLELYGI